MKQLILSTLCFFTALSNYAYDFEMGDIYYNRDISTQTASVTYKSTSDGGYSGVVRIPSIVKWNGVVYTVTRIDNQAFNHCKGLTDVVIPNTITTINNSAFTGCI